MFTGVNSNHVYSVYFLSSSMTSQQTFLFKCQVGHCDPCSYSIEKKSSHYEIEHKVNFSDSDDEYHWRGVHQAVLHHHKTACVWLHARLGWARL